MSFRFVSLWKEHAIELHIVFRVLLPVHVQILALLFHLGQASDILKVLGILEHLHQKPKPFLLVFSENCIGAGCAAIIRLTRDEKVLEAGEESTDLMRQESEGRAKCFLRPLVVVICFVGWGPHAMSVGRVSTELMFAHPKNSMLA